MKDFMVTMAILTVVAVTLLRLTDHLWKDR